MRVHFPLLKLFIQGHNRETGKDLSKDQVVAQAFTFLLAGYETTANTLGYAIYLLAKNKDKERALIDEIDRLGEGKSELPTVEELKSYEYVDAVLSEVLRITGDEVQSTRGFQSPGCSPHRGKAPKHRFLI